MARANFTPAKLAFDLHILMNLTEFVAKVNALEKNSVALSFKSKPKTQTSDVEEFVFPFSAHYSEADLTQYFEDGLTPEDAHQKISEDINSIVLENDSLYVRLKTISDLETFWIENHEKYPFFAGRGIESSLLGWSDFIFSTSKVAAVKAALRWDQFGIRCQWYDWKNDKSSVLKESDSDYQSWFANRESERKSLIKDECWTSFDEEQYRLDCIYRTPETYHGWWILVNLPLNLRFEGDIFPLELLDSKTLIDPTLSNEDVENRYQEIIFDTWSIDHRGEYPCAFGTTIYDFYQDIQYWRNERDAGEEYFGFEFEDIPDVNLVDTKFKPNNSPSIKNTVEPILNAKAPSKPEFREIEVKTSDYSNRFDFPSVPVTSTSGLNPLVRIAESLSKRREEKRLQRIAEQAAKLNSSSDPNKQSDVMSDTSEPMDFATRYLNRLRQRSLEAAALRAKRDSEK